VGAPVDRIGRRPVPVQVATIQRRPATIRPLHPVRHDHMGMQQRIARPRGAVVEPDRQQPVAVHVFVAAMPAARADVVLQVRQRLRGRLVVGLQHVTGDLGVSEAVQQRHALGRPQHQIECRNAMFAVGAAKELAGVGVAAVEHPHERLGGRDAALAERLGAAAEPAAWWLSVAGQVLFAVFGDLADVVVLPANRPLRDVRDHTKPPRAQPGGRHCDTLVHCSRTDSGRA
jgi:hypothetical protein